MLKHIRKGKKSVNVNLKVTPEQMEQMVVQAKKYTGGNLSEWVRYATTELKPPRSELVPND